MKLQTSFSSRKIVGSLAACAVVLASLVASGGASAIETPLSNTPVRATSKVPANVMLALSVEWPTGVVQAYNDEMNTICPGRDGSADSVCYVASKTYIGYFDPFKCYNYDTIANYFVPAGYTIGASAVLPNAGLKTCVAQWSGNYLNWATMQTTDMFRWAMTGGDRFTDTSTLTVLEKARHDGQGGFGQFPIKRIGGANVGGGATVIQPVLPSTVSPYTSGQLFVRIQGMNTVMWVSKARAPVTGNHPVTVNNPSNTLDVPAPSVQTFTEEGLCAAYIGPGVCTQVVTSSTGTRQLTVPVTSIDEAGQCPVAGSISCVNTAAPAPGTRQYQYTKAVAGVTCPSSDPNQIACTPSAIGTRTAQLTEAGQCPPPAAPAGTTYSACSNPTVATSTVSRVETGTCASVTNPAGTAFVSCANLGLGTFRFQLTEPGVCPPPPAPAGVSYGSCTNLTSPNRRRFNVTGPGQCSTLGAPPSGSTYASCINLTSPTRTVVRTENGTCATLGVVSPNTCAPASVGTRTYTTLEPGQCNRPIVAGVTVNSCSNSTPPAILVTAVSSGQCPPIIPTGGTTLVAGSCTNLTASNTGTRTVVRNVVTSEAGQCATYTGPPTCANTTAPVLTSIRQISGTTVSVDPYFVRVKVCDPAFPETQTTCTLYSNGTSYKPTGTIQENALNMRFGAFGYLLDNDQLRDGGVLRAKMKDVGPLKAVPQNPAVTNTAAEWSAITGIYVNNPDAADATATGLGATNSGVINYLNKFGRKAGYKSFDPVGEMYAEVIKYFKQGRSPTTSYVSGLTSAFVDGFPVITSWNDPIQYSCQQNFVIGISDANAHKDKNLSGGVAGVENEPASLPGSIDTDYNVTTWTNTVGGLEASLVARIAAPSGATTYGNDLATLRNCCNGSAFLAGLAYYAHTTDLRADFDNLNGPQVLTSFFVDVREATSWGTNPTGDPRNQLWLAAKYGGFKDVNKNGMFDTGDTWSDPAQGTVQGRPVPKNYFAANQPEKLVDGLQRAFREIVGLTGAGAGVGVAASNLSQTTGENGIYQVTFDTSDWSGTVTGSTILSIDQTTGAIALRAPAFEAGGLLLTKAAGSGWDTGRVMVTAVPGATQLGQPFRLANLNPAQLAALGPTALEQQDVLNYIRGQKTKEETDALGTPIIGGKYRVRTKLLADIVDSEAVFVGKPKGEYIDEFNPGYNAFKIAKAGRTPVIYVGANAGQLHAFNAIVDPLDSNFANAGQEIMAFVPSLTYVGPNNTPLTDGLRSLSVTTAFVHHYLVNATPSQRDVDFNHTDGNMTTTPDWHSLLVGGLGKGGRGFYALDVTDPADFATETSAATKVLWEFTDADMGYSFGLPLIVKTRKWGWVVMVSSGYNNITSAVTADRGLGFLYILNARTGALLQKIGTGTGTEAIPSGFSPISAYTPSFADYTTDEVYGGDLFGNLWRFDLRSATATVPTPLLFATLKDASNVGQPITTIPLIEYSVNDSKRYVFVGTGRFLDQADIANAQQQSFYAIRDGNIGQRFETTASATGEALPAGVTFPITRSVLANNSDLVTGLTTSQISTNPMGWYYNLTGVVNNTATPPVAVARERISLNPKASQGFVTWVGNVPDVNACNPNGVSRQYATSYGGGKSLLYTTNVAGVRTYSAYTETRALVKSQLVNVGDGVRILGTDDKGVPFLIGNPLNAFGAGRLLNWREILQ